MARTLDSLGIPHLTAAVAAISSEDLPSRAARNAGRRSEMALVVAFGGGERFDCVTTITSRCLLKLSRPRVSRRTFTLKHPPCSCENELRGHDRCAKKTVVSPVFLD